MASWRAIALLAIVGATPARAETGVQAALSLSAGANDNIQSTSTGTEWDGMTVVRPSLSLRAVTPRATQRLAASFFANVYWRHTEASVWSATLDYSGLFELSQRTHLVLGASLLRSSLRSFSTIAGSEAAVVGALPAGGLDFFQAAARERLTFDLTERWRLSQSLAATALLPDQTTSVPRAWDVDLRLGFDRSWQHDLATLEARGDFTRYDALDAAGSAARQQVLSALQLRWRHDLSSAFTTELGAGVELAVRPEDGGGRHVEPDGLAAIRYSHPSGRAELGYAHGMQPNVLLAQTLVLDEVALRAALPLGATTGLELTASAAWQRGRRLDGDSGAELGSIDVWLADASLQWRALDALGLFARYQFSDQSGDLAGSPLPSLRRNIVFVGLDFVWPPETSAIVTAGWRADRSDEQQVASDRRAPLR